MSKMENGLYTHTEKEVTEDTKELLAMKTASIEAATNKASRSGSETGGFWKGLALFNLYKGMR